MAQKDFLVKIVIFPKYNLQSPKCGKSYSRLLIEIKRSRKANAPVTAKTYTKYTFLDRIIIKQFASVQILLF